MNVKIKGKVYMQNSGKTSTGVRGRDIGIEEGTGNWRPQKYECYDRCSELRNCTG